MSQKHSEEPTIPDFIDMMIEEKQIRKSEEEAAKKHEEDKFWEDYCEGLKNDPLFRRK